MRATEKPDYSVGRGRLKFVPIGRVFRTLYHRMTVGGKRGERQSTRQARHAGSTQKRKLAADL